MYLFLLYTLFHFVSRARSTCVSYGIDFVNGGSYFIDNTLSIDFTFLSEFEGCDNESITPILVDPDENEYFCSDIQTSPDDTSTLSTCPVLQTAMFNGDWYIVIEGLTFAYVRTFEITVGVPTTITATPTVTVGFTTLPDAVTSTTTSTSLEATTALPSTITDACKTKYIISTVIPPPAYTTVVKTLTVTSTTKTVSKTTSSTITSTAICTPPPYPKGADPALQKVLKLPHTTISPPSSSSQKKNNHRGRSHARDIDVEYPKRVKRGIKAAFNFARNGGVLLRRGPNEATVTVTETTYTYVTTTTSILPTSTVVQTTWETAMTTVTPSAVTVCQGLTKITSTTTLPTHTFTSLSVKKTTVYVTKSITLCHTFKTTTTPKALSTSCVKNGGSI